MLPPLPPLPPAGPPNGTCASLRQETIPSPPLPAFIKTLQRSIKDIFYSISYKIILIYFTKSFFKIKF